LEATENHADILDQGEKVLMCLKIVF